MATISCLVWARTDSMNRSAIQPEPRSPHRNGGASLAGAIRDTGNKVGRGIEYTKDQWWLLGVTQKNHYETGTSRRLDRVLISFGSSSLLGELDRLPALERFGGFIGQQLGFQPVLQRGARRDTFGDRLDESVQGLVIALLDALEPAGMQAVFDNFITDITRHPTEPLAAGFDQAFGAKHFPSGLIRVGRITQAKPRQNLGYAL